MIGKLFGTLPWMVTCVSFMMLSSRTSLAAEGTTQQGAEPNVVSIHVPSGSYVFAAFGNTIDKTVVPFGKNRCLIDCKISITGFPNAPETERTGRRFDIRYQNTKPDSRGVTTWAEWTQYDKAKDEKGTEDIALKVVDATKEIGGDGVQVYKIPYAAINGQTRFLLFAVAKTSQPFAKLFSIPKTQRFETFDWNRWADFN